MNNYNPNIHHRRSIRLKGYDYSKAGLYFITICLKDRVCLFGKISNGKIILNDAGIMIENEWLKIPDRFPNVKLHQYVIMPNHFHAIMEITAGATLVVAGETPVDRENDTDENKGATVTPGATTRFQQESLSALDSPPLSVSRVDGCPFCSGIPVLFQQELVSAFSKNCCPFSARICNSQHLCAMSTPKHSCAQYFKDTI